MPSPRTPVVTWALVAANLALFGWQVFGVGLEDSVRRGGAIPYEILTFEDVQWRALVPPPFTILTSMFLHGGGAHLATNLAALWIFGTDVEGALGRVRFVALYLVAGIAAALAQTVAAAASGDALVPVVGASGAIAGLLAAFLVLFPRARVRLVRIPAGLFIVLWFLLQVLAVLLGGDPGVAFMAHVGGFVAGWLLVRLVGRDPEAGARERLGPGAA